MTEKPEQPVVVINHTKNELDILTTAQAAKESGISAGTILNSLKSDDPDSLKGRNFGGRRGWCTTRRALADWVESGNAPVPDGTDEDESDEGPFTD